MRSARKLARELCRFVFDRYPDAGIEHIELMWQGVPLVRSSVANQKAMVARCGAPYHPIRALDMTNGR